MGRRDLYEELEQLEALQDHLRGLLADIAHAVKGPPKPGTVHEWGDLPEKVRKLVVDHKHLRTWWENHVKNSAEDFERVAVDLGSVRRDAEVAGFRKGVVATLQRLHGIAPELPAADAIVAIEPDEIL